MPDYSPGRDPGGFVKMLCTADRSKVYRHIDVTARKYMKQVTAGDNLPESLPPKAEGEGEEMTAEEFLTSFFAALAEDVTWTAIGSTPISGVSHSKAEYMQKTSVPLQSVFAGSTSCKVMRMVAEDNVVAVEWHGETPLANGGMYANDYCWVIGVSGKKITEVTGYLDTSVVNTLFYGGNVDN